MKHDYIVQAKRLYVERYSVVVSASNAKEARKLASPEIHSQEFYWENTEQSEPEITFVKRLRD